MSIFMNGPDSPTFPTPTWINVSEPHLWSDGIPDCMTFGASPDSGEPYLAIYATREDALRFAGPEGRPLAVTDPIVFLALLSNAVRIGAAKQVVRVCPERRGREFWSCDAAKLLATLGAAFRSAQR